MVSGKKIPLKFPYRCPKCKRDVEAIHVINIDGADYVVCDCELKTLPKEPIADFIDRLQMSINTLETAHKSHVSSVKSLIEELKGE